MGCRARCAGIWTSALKRSTGWRDGCKVHKPLFGNMNFG
jgi:hypothetical protein